MIIDPFAFADRLSSELGNDFYFSPRPDHPHLALPPDLLIGGRGLLTAVFMDKARESLRSLIARLGTSRLALPTNTRCILVAPKEQLPREAFQHFHEVFDPGQFSVLLKYLETDYQDDKHHDIPSEIISKHRVRYQQILTHSADRLLARDPGQLPERILYEYRALSIENDLRFPLQKEIIGNQQIAVINAKSFGLIAFLKSESGKLEASALRRLAIESFHNDYDLDTGVPYPAKFGSNMLVVQGIPSSRLDPLRAVRAAAFSGWAVGMFDSVRELMDSIELVHDSLKSN